MTTPADITAVLFDLGGVLVNKRPDHQLIAQIFGFKEEDSAATALVDHAIWAHRDDYDSGCSDRQFWDRVAGDCGLAEITDDLLAQLVKADCDRMSHVEKPVLEIVQALHQNDVLCGILTNAPHAIGNAIFTSDWYQENFEFALFSADLGIRKPHRAIYTAAVDRLGIPAEKILFVDDRLEHLRAAEKIGMQTLHWDNSNTEVARAQLLSIAAA